MTGRHAHRRRLRSGRRTAPATLAAGFTLAGFTMAGVAGCGVPLEDRAAVTPAEDLPYELKTPPPVDDPTTATSGGAPAVLFLLRDDTLVQVTRAVSDPADLNGLLAELAAPLSPAETDEGLRRALSNIDLIGGVTRTANVATVELDPTFNDLAPHEQILALGQIVFTLTERDEVDRVRFTRDGEPITIPTGSGSLVDGSVTRYDYRSLR